MKRITQFTIIYSLIVAMGISQVRLKDIASVENTEQQLLLGYGLVVGLSGTGDRSNVRRGAVFTVQSISNMLERFGITVPKEQLRTRNVAAAMVTGATPPYGRIGSKFDVTVSSLGDATSLEGGILLMTPLLAPDGTYYAQSQGAISIGGYNVETSAGERLRKNHALVGRVPNGGALTVDMPSQTLDLNQPLRLSLHEPDFVTASRIAQEINMINGGYTTNNGLIELNNIARPISSALIEVTLPETIMTQEDAIFFIASIETLYVEPDVEARVVLNERTGTIVAGTNVNIQEVMISHGSLTIHTSQVPIISQPSASFSNTGQTVVVPVTNTTAQEENSTIAMLPKTSTVGDLAIALNQLGLKPRDIIAIFQSLKEAGALNAKLIII
ncbi:MAG: flagellar basal body P-ring protein FlgI [Simkaniaceae bacterium]|nr:flagellar basal body P-ring protein FlgI [Simkaniaceae bacterium]